MSAVRRNGETNPVTVLLALAIAAAGFYVYHVAPVYMDNLEAKEAAAEAFNIYWTNGPQAAKNNLLIRLNGVKSGTSHLAVDENGQEVILPGLGLTEENIEIINDEQTAQLSVRVTYERVVRFAPLKKSKRFFLVAEKKGKRLK